MRLIIQCSLAVISVAATTARKAQTQGLKKLRHLETELLFCHWHCHQFGYRASFTRCRLAGSLDTSRA